MPGRHIYKHYLPQTYYHVYNRGVNKQAVFLDERDYTVFLGLLKRYLGENVELNSNREPYPSYHGRVDLAAFCLMPNHFHLFVYQHDAEGMKQLLRSLTIAYSMYFNKRYKRVGPVFQQRYRAVIIDQEAQLLHISRYIHLNPKDYQNWKWSSLPYYKGEKSADWLKTGHVLDQFKDTADYLNFVAEYRNRGDEPDSPKQDFADA